MFVRLYDRLLLLNHLANLDETWHGYSLCTHEANLHLRVQVRAPAHADPRYTYYTYVDVAAEAAAGGLFASYFKKDLLHLFLLFWYFSCSFLSFSFTSMTSTNFSVK